MNSDIISLGVCEIIECQCTTTLKLFGTLYEHEVTVSSEQHVSQIRIMAHHNSSSTQLLKNYARFSKSH